MAIFYNITEENEKTIKWFAKVTKTQDEKILIFFKTHPSQKYTPEEVFARVFGRTKVPLTSIRRSMTNLTKKDCLVKTCEKKISSYGRPAYMWKLKDCT